MWNLGLLGAASASESVPFLVESSGFGVVTPSIGDNTHTFTFNNSLQQGDIVMIIVGDDNEQLQSFQEPNISGYTTVFSDRFGVACYFAYKVMGATPDTSFSVKNSKEDTTSIGYMVWRGISPASPIAQVSLQADGDGGMPDPPSITTTGANHLVLFVGYLDDDRVAATIASPTGYPAPTVTSQSGSGGSTVMATALISGAEGETYDPTSFIDTGGLGNDVWIARTIEFNNIPA